MNIYDVAEIENQIDQIALLNEGEISEDMLQKLVEAQTGSVQQIEKLVKYVKYLGYFQETAKLEESRISELRKRAEKRETSIKTYLTPFVELRGKFDAGTFKLSTRMSEQVDVAEGFNIKKYMKKVVTITVDKMKIREDLKAGKKIQGARLRPKTNLQIK